MSGRRFTVSQSRDEARADSGVSEPVSAKQDSHQEPSLDESNTATAAPAFAWSGTVHPWFARTLSGLTPLEVKKEIEEWLAEREMMSPMMFPSDTSVSEIISLSLSELLTNPQ